MYRSDQRMLVACAHRIAFNINECAFIDSEKRKAKGVLISSMVRNARLHYQVNRQIRHQPLIHGTTAAGDV
jgi:hypothetical protein